MLVGIAKLAQAGATLASKRRVEYRQLPTRKIINRCSGSRMPFEWTINPYRGCEFGCKYCYARYTHEFMELRDPEDFETKIFAKEFTADSFRRELLAIPRNHTIALGTATDPWQPAERRYGLTRRILEVFAGQRGRRLAFTTKSDLVVRDLDLLTVIARHNHLSANFTVTTCETALARLLEPLAPRPDLRLQAAAESVRTGIDVRIFASPVLPAINDSWERLESVASAAAAIGARGFGAHLVFLQPCAQAVMFPFLEQEFPHLAAGYRENFGARPYPKRALEEELQAKVATLRARYRLDGRTAGPAVEMAGGYRQMALFHDFETSVRYPHGRRNEPEPQRKR